MKRQIAVLLLALAPPLTGCVPDHWPEKWRHMASDSPKEEAQAAVPQWCYRSLARIDCYDAPLPDAGDRLVSAPRIIKPKQADKNGAATPAAVAIVPQPPPIPLHAP